MEKFLNKNVKLNNGVEMPVVGFGTYKITDPVEGETAIVEAINFGYRMIDTADVYQNHAIVKKAIARSSKTRQDLFITSKIWNTDQSREKTLASFNRILTELDTDYLDLVLVHWPAKNGNECYHALEQLYKEGKVRAIGVSNYLVDDLKGLIAESEIKPMVDQVEMHPMYPVLDLQAFAKENDIQIESWRTMMGGQFDDAPYVVELSEKYHVQPSSIALRWALQSGVVIIPKSVHVDRIKTNASQIDEFLLTDEEMEKINKLQPSKRLGPDPLVYDRK